MFEAVPSPDEKRLLYSNKDGVFVRDLAGGADRQLAPAAGGTNRCLAWAPDGNRISFRASESQAKSARAWLSVSDLNGKTKVIWESWVGGTSTDCDVHWIAPDRLIFERVLGVSAQQQKAGAVVLANTTTTVTLKEPISSSDMEARWSIRGICPVGTVAVVTPLHKDGPIAIATDLKDLKTLNPSPISCSVCKFAGFAAKSCVPFFLAMGEGKNTGVFSLNPGNWQRQRMATIDQPLGMTSQSLVSSSAKWMVVGDGPSLYLVNTDSGDHSNLLPQPPAASSGKKVIAVEPILWIEN
ncbi:MAG TPA: hypothetical protein VHR36_04240 [Pyrinomonadaceae bacterium]|nr:hypothetical protein [Pyrinomonadaceae bacterium]